jgi:hypothetical protein
VPAEIAAVCEANVDVALIGVASENGK